MQAPRLRLHTLPPDALNTIYAHLPYPSLSSLFSTCHTLRAPSTDPSSPLWRAIASNRPLHPPPTHTSSPRHAARLADAALATFASSTAALSPAASHAVANNNVLATASATGVSLWDASTPWSGPPALSHPRLGPVGHLALSPSNALAVSSATSAALHSRQSLAPSRPIRNRGPVTALAFVGPLLACATADGSIRLADASSRRARGVLRGHGGAVRYLAPLGGRLVSAAGERLKLWDVEAGVCLATARLNESVVEVVVDEGRETAYVAAGESVRVMDLRGGGIETAAVLSVPRRFRGAIGGMAVREDGFVAVGVGGGGAVVWEGRGGWEGRGIGWMGFGGHRESRRICAVAATSHAVVIGGRDGRVAILGLEGEWSEPAGVGELGEEGEVRSPVRKLIVGGSREESLVVVRRDGDVRCLDMLSEDVVVDWDKAASSCGIEDGGSRFWAGQSSTSSRGGRRRRGERDTEKR